MDRGAWWATVHGVAELAMTERLTLFTFTKALYQASLVAEMVITFFTSLPAESQRKPKNTGVGSVSAL